MKYFLHNVVKKYLVKETKYEEQIDIKELIDEFSVFEDLKGRDNVTETTLSQISLEKKMAASDADS